VAAAGRGRLVRQTRELRRASTQASYDEKKRKKSRAGFIDFFRRVLPVVVALRTRSRKTCRNSCRNASTGTTQYYRTPTAGFQIAAGRM
jgi:hypothetical protein